MKEINLYETLNKYFNEAIFNKYNMILYLDVKQRKGDGKGFIMYPLQKEDDEKEFILTSIIDHLNKLNISIEQRGIYTIIISKENFENLLSYLKLAGKIIYYTK